MVAAPALGFAAGLVIATITAPVIGALTYAMLALFTRGSVAPDWPVGPACGLGGLGRYLGARLQPVLPERAGMRGLVPDRATCDGPDRPTAG